MQLREEEFQKYSARFSPEIIQTWESMDDTPRMVNNKLVSVHEAKIKNGM
jgi:hypothetical protein